MMILPKQMNGICMKQYIFRMNIYYYRTNPQVGLFMVVCKSNKSFSFL
jgi:hypothetical protein